MVKLRAARPMIIAQEKSKVCAPDGKRPVPAGPLPRREAWPLLAAEAARPARTEKRITELHRRQS
jgi:hypothetical protein